MPELFAAHFWSAELASDAVEQVVAPAHCADNCALASAPTTHRNWLRRFNDTLLHSVLPTVFMAFSQSSVIARARRAEAPCLPWPCSSLCCRRHRCRA
eukprot:6175120-Pleurochrysis_carterae.AAC.1